jgi:hypothetical protein
VKSGYAMRIIPWRLPRPARAAHVKFLLTPGTNDRIRPFAA